MKKNNQKTSNMEKIVKHDTAWKVSKYGVISVPYFPVFSANTGKYGPEITTYLDTFQAVCDILFYFIFNQSSIR